MYVNKIFLRPGAPGRLSAMVRKKTGMTKSAQRERTRRRLLQLAREEFSKKGFAGLATERLVARAKLTRGALYHQFADKKDLFRAVFEDAQGEIVAAIVAAAEAAPDDWSVLRDGCRAFLEAASRPQIQRIVLVDGPAVLGWEEWRRIDAENGIRELRAGLADLMEKKIIKKGDVEALAFMLSGAMNDAALWIAAAESRDQALSTASATLDLLLEGLREKS